VIFRLRALVRQHLTGQTFLFPLNRGVLILQVVSGGIGMQGGFATAGNMQDIAPKGAIKEVNFHFADKARPRE
jgi:hypothetical protein